MSIYTDWFPVSVKPVHVGWYEVDKGTHVVRRFFDGTYWYAQSYVTNKYGPVKSPYPWRGLKEKPE